MRQGNVLSRGFTLIELIVVIAVLSIAAVAIGNLYAGVFFGQEGNADMQVGTKLMQECAEQVVSVRRVSGYAAVAGTVCDNLAAFGGYAAPTVILNAYAGPGCPGACQMAEITQGGMASIWVMLADDE